MAKSQKDHPVLNTNKGQFCKLNDGLKIFYQKSKITSMNAEMQQREFWIFFFNSK